MLSRDNNWQNPFGDGEAGEKIVKIIMEGEHG
jgi:UDP-N-acetylglucosamine 2-epimerase